MAAEAKEAPTTVAERFGAAAVGALAAELSTLPMDITKVRLQTQAPLPDGSWRYTGFFQALGRIAVDEGPSVLWRGIEPALVRQISYTSLSFVLYEPMRDFIAGDAPAEKIPFWKRVLAGGGAGAVSIVAVNPTDVIKTQMQVTRAATEAPLRMSECAATVYANAGLPGFWRGWQPNAARSFVGCACEIGIYDEAKTRLRRLGVPDGPLLFVGASLISGVISGLFSTPLDVVKTRLMAQAGGGKTELAVRYTGVLDCFVRMPQHEGLGSLFKVRTRPVRPFEPPHNPRANRHRVTALRSLLPGDRSAHRAQDHVGRAVLSDLRGRAQGAEALGGRLERRHCGREGSGQQKDVLARIEASQTRERASQLIIR